MTKKVIAGIAIGVAAVVLIAAMVFFRRQPLTMEDHPRVSYIGVTQGIDGAACSADIPKQAIPDELSDTLVSLFANAEVRRAFPSPTESYGNTITDDTVYIDIRISLGHGSMHVALSNVPDYNFARGDHEYSLVDSKKLYQDVYEALPPDLISEYMEPWE